MDLNIEIDAGNVTGGLDGAVSALERVKRLVESTEPFGTHLAKGSKVEVDGLMAQMRRLVNGVEGDMKRVASALKEATPKDMREELQRTLAPMKQLVTLAAELSKAKFSGLDGAKAAGEVRKTLEAVKQLADSYDQLTVQTNRQAVAAQSAAAKTAQANLQAKANLDAQVRAAQGRLQAFIQNHPAGVLPARPAPAPAPALAGMNMGSYNGPSPAQLAAQATAAATATTALATAQAGANAAAKTGQATSVSLTQALKGQAASANDLHSAYRGLASGFGAMWLTWGNALPLLAGAGLSHAVTGAIKAGMQFETVMTNMGAQADITGKDMSKLTATVLEMGAARERGPKELAEGLKVLALAGQNAAQQMQTLPTLLDFAKVGEMGLDQAAEQLVAVGAAFGYQANEMQVVADVIAKTAASSMASTSDMAQAFRSASVLATQFNVSLKDVAGGLGLLSQIGIKGSAAGTSLRQAYVELTGTSKGAREALEKMGISIYNAEGGTRSLRDVVTQLAGKMEGLSKSQRDHLLQVISNERGMKTLAAVMAQLQQEAANAGTGMTSFLQKLEKDIGNAAGYTALKAIEMGQTTEQQFKRVAATLETSFVKAFEVAQPAVNQLAAALREALGSQEFVNAVAAIASTLVSLATVVVKNIELISLLGGAYVASKVGLTAFHAIAALLGPALTAAGIGASAAATATGSLTTAAGIAARAFWPLAAAIAAAAAAYSLYKALSGSADADARAKAAAAGSEAADMQKRAAEMRKTAEDIRSGMSAGTSEEISRFSKSTEAALAALDDRAGKLRQENAKLEKVQSQNAYYNEQRAERLRANEQKINAIYQERNKVQSEFLKGRQALLQGASAVERATEDRAKRDAERAQKLFAGVADPKMVKLADSGGGGGRTRAPREGMEMGEGDLAKAKAHNDELDRTIKLYREAAAAGASVDKLTESQKKELLIKQQLQTEMKGEVRARKEAELAEVQASIAKEKTLETLKEEAKEREKVKESTAKLTDSIRKQADDLEVANGVFGKGKIAIGEATLAQMEAGKAMGALIKINGDWVEATQEMIAAQKKLNEEMREAEYKKVMKDLDGQLAGARDQADLLRQEAELVGLTALERAKVVALHKVELDYRKRIRDIDLSELSDSQKEVARERVAQTRAVEASNAVNKVIQDDFQKTADQINQSLTDALLRGFEDGKGFGKNFRDTLMNMFKTLVLRPVISFIVNPIGNAISGLISGFLGGGQGQGGIGGMVSNGSSLLNLFNGGGSNLATMFGFGEAGAGSIFDLLSSSSMGALDIGGVSAGALGGLAVVAAPLIIGALAESATRDRFSGAAFATSNFAKDPTITIGGAEYDPIKGILPDRDALVGRALEAGIGQEMIDRFRGRDRALLHYITMLDANRQSGNEGPPINVNALLENDNMYAADWYRGQGYAHPQAMGWWNDKGYGLASNDPAITTASRAVATSIVGPLTEINRILGGAADDFRVTAGYATRGGGKGVWAGLNISQGGNSLVDWVDKDNFNSPQEAVRGMYEQALGALEKLDLPKWAREQVDGAQAAMAALSGDKMGEEAAALYAQTTASVAQTIKTIDTLIKVFPDFAGQTQDTVHAIGVAMGGLENLTSGYQNYLQGFYSEAERRALATKQLEGQFAELGLSLPATRDGFRALVEAQDLSTEAGRRAFAALIGLSGAFAELSAASTSAFADAQALAGVIRDGLLGNIAAEDLGGRMADVVIGGIYNAIAGGFADQITQIMMSGVITPMIQAAVTGASISEAVSQATIDKMVADATRVAEALGTILNNPAFRGAMSQIEQMMLNLAPRIAPTKPYYVPYETRRNEAERARQEADRARQQAADEAARRAEQVASERLGLTKQLLELEGHRAALRQIELNQLDPSNHALQERIWALQDAAEAEAKHAAALKEANDFLKSVTSNIKSFVAGLNTQTSNPGVNYQQAWAAYNTQLAFARGGDRDALGSITNYASTLADSIRQNAQTGAEADLLIGRMRGQLMALPNRVTPEQLIVNAVEDMKNTLSGVLVQKFDQLDNNVDGLLTFSELQASGLASDAQIRALISRVDVNGDGMISKTEAVRAQAELTKLGVTTVNNSIGDNTTATSNWGQYINSSTVTGLNSVEGRVGDVDTSVLSGNVIAGNIKDSTTYLRSIDPMVSQSRVELDRIHSKIASVTTGAMSFTVNSRNQTTGGWTMFAQGGVFTNSVVSGPTPFSMGLMGEAGPEAIMPLTRTPSGELGVRALGNGGGASLSAELAALRAEVAALREEARAQASAVVQVSKRTAQATERSARISEDWDRNGKPVDRKEVVA